MNINDFKEMALGAFEFVSSSFFRGLFQEKGKQTVEKKPEKKEELITQKSIINATESICFVLCMTSLGYVSSFVFLGVNPQKLPTIMGTSMFSISLAAVSKRIKE